MRFWTPLPRDAPLMILLVLTSAVWDRLVPAPRLQAEEARRADQLVSVVAAKNHLAAHQEVAAVSVTEFWRPGVLTLHRRWMKEQNR